ncbi:MAG: hypothetical protein AAF732_11065 [Pseudomonadota bacterium]
MIVKIAASNSIVSFGVAPSAEADKYGESSDLGDLYLGINGGYTDGAAGFNILSDEPVYSGEGDLLSGDRCSCSDYGHNFSICGPGFNASRGFIGGHVGRLRRNGQIVIGVEGSSHNADIDRSDEEARGGDLRTIVDQFGSLFFIMGYAFDRLFVSDEIGIATIQVQTIFPGDLTGRRSSYGDGSVWREGQDERWRHGFVTSAVGEYALAANIAIDVNFSEYDFGRKSIIVDGPVPRPKEWSATQH